MVLRVIRPGYARFGQQLQLRVVIANRAEDFIGMFAQGRCRTLHIIGRSRKLRGWPGLSERAGLWMIKLLDQPIRGNLWMADHFVAGKTETPR